MSCRQGQEFFNSPPLPGRLSAHPVSHAKVVRVFSQELKRPGRKVEQMTLPDVDVNAWSYASTVNTSVLLVS